MPQLSRETCKPRVPHFPTPELPGCRRSPGPGAALDPPAGGQRQLKEVAAGAQAVVHSEGHHDQRVAQHRQRQERRQQGGHPRKWQACGLGCSPSRYLGPRAHALPAALASLRSVAEMTRGWLGELAAVGCGAGAGAGPGGARGHRGKKRVGEGTSCSRSGAEIRPRRWGWDPGCVG